jgi:hypothetical protein
MRRATRASAALTMTCSRLSLELAMKMEPWAGRRVLVEVEVEVEVRVRMEGVAKGVVATIKVHTSVIWKLY